MCGGGSGWSQAPPGSGSGAHDPGRCRHRSLRRAGLLRCARPDRGRPRPGPPQRRHAGTPGAGDRHCLGTRPAAPARRLPAADDRDELDLHLGPLAGHRRHARLVGLPTLGRLPADPQRDADLRSHRTGDLRGVPGGTATIGRPRPGRHRHRILPVLPGPAAARSGQPVRGDAESARRLGPADGAGHRHRRPPPHRALHRRAAAGRDDRCRDPHGQPLHHRRGRRSGPGPDQQPAGRPATPPRSPPPAGVRSPVPGHGPAKGFGPTAGPLTGEAWETHRGSRLGGLRGGPMVGQQAKRRTAGGRG